jgi:OOP family OmpA-OmpF porin
MSAAKALPPAALGKVEILPRLAAPYAFTAEKSGNQVVLSGFVPDERTHADWLAWVKNRFFGDEIVDRLELARGMPPDFDAAVKLGLGQLSRLDSGTLSMANDKFSLRGVVLFDRAGQQIKDALASSLPKNFKGESELTVKQRLANKFDASTCQSQLTQTNGRGRILFGTGNATIDETAHGLLDALAFVAANCSTERIVVTGYTDAVGQADANLDLSKRRAQAVADYLIAAGIPAKRIKVVGLGQTHPIASNDTEEGRAMNRRIEFSVQ